ncbi:MAG: hypothetical protein K940chlam9_00685, partial [Chlamydiae bacterium]|nr:hypothetical protein [Chlamydiota bacterium]
MFSKTPPIGGARRKPLLMRQTPMMNPKKTNKATQIVRKKLTSLRLVSPGPFKIRVKKIPKMAWKICKDSNWMLLMVEFFGIAGKACSLVGKSTAKYIPFLGIVSAPFYLFHSVRFAKQRLEMMRVAYRASKIADAFFWGTRAIGDLGTAISDIVKPFAGGLQIAKASIQSPAVACLFNLILPVVLIVLGAVGGLSEGWALLRSGKALHKFNKLASNQDEPLHQVGELIAYLERPPHEVSISSDEDTLARKQYDEYHYTGPDRKKAIETRFTSLKEVHDIQQIRSLYEKVVAKEVKDFVTPLLEGKEKVLHKEGLIDILSVLKEIDILYGDLTGDQIEEIESIETLASLSGKLLTLFNTMKDHPKWDAEYNQILPVIKSLEENLGALQEMKETLLAEGGELLDHVKSEIHRNILYHFAFVLMSAMTLSAGILFLLSNQYHVVAACMALTSSALGVTYVLFDKFVSQEKFLQMERFLKTIQAR